MKFASQLQLQAYLDGELPEGERREVESWLARDSAAQALLAELSTTRAVLVDHEREVKLPESRDFYWSKIEREILRREAPARLAERPSWLARWRRVLAPVGVAAALVLVLVVSLQMYSGAARIPQPEVTLVDGHAIAYRDQDRGMTLVWFSYPADDYAEGGLGRTLQN